MQTVEETGLQLLKGRRGRGESFETEGTVQSCPDRASQGFPSAGSSHPIQRCSCHPPTKARPRRGGRAGWRAEYGKRGGRTGQEVQGRAGVPLALPAPEPSSRDRSCDAGARSPAPATWVSQVHLDPPAPLRLATAPLPRGDLLDCPPPPPLPLHLHRSTIGCRGREAGLAAPKGVLVRTGQRAWSLALQPGQAAVLVTQR